jgi:hypothetical protein
MPVNKGAQRSGILLDWFTVSYRSIILSIVVGVVLLAGTGGALYYKFFYQETPRTRAAEAISEAEDLLGRVTDAGTGEDGQDLKRSAQKLMAEARRHFDASNYENATRAAEQSQMSSQRILSMGKGEVARSAQFYRLEGDVRVKRAKELIWQPAEKGMTLSAGDQIKTDSRAAAQIIYFNGTITTVTPGSLLEIRELYDNPSTKVQKVREQLRAGRLASTTQDAKAKGSYHEISTKNAVATTQSRSSLAVEFDESSQRTSLEVHSGRARVKAGSREVAVEAREGIRVSGANGEAAKVSLPAAPSLVSPIDQKIIQLGEADDTPVELVWQAVPGAASYHIQLSSKALFSAPQVDRNMRTTAATLPSATRGNYYWRVATVMVDGTEGPMSNTRKFRVVEGTLTPLGDKDPPPLKIDDFLQFATQVIVRGKTEPGASLSVNGDRIDVYEDGSFTSVIPLRMAGRQKLVFVAQDVAGNTSRVERQVTVDAF